MHSIQTWSPHLPIFANHSSSRIFHSTSVCFSFVARVAAAKDLCGCLLRNSPHLYPTSRKVGWPVPGRRESWSVMRSIDLLQDWRTWMFVRRIRAWALPGVCVSMFQALGTCVEHRLRWITILYWIIGLVRMCWVSVVLGTCDFWLHECGHLDACKACQAIWPSRESEGRDW